MGFFQNILDNLSSRSSADYTNAYQGGINSIMGQQALANRYTGNLGYQNALQQAAQGAGVMANQAVANAINAARAGGMSKAQAAAMGNQAANNAYASNFANQQNVATGLGQNAIAAQQGITGALQGQASQAAAEKQNAYNRAWGNIEKGEEQLGRLGQVLTPQ